MVKPARTAVARTATAGASKAASLVRELRGELRRNADPARAGMQRYMKSAMPYHGIPTPALRPICGHVFARHPLSSAASWTEAVLALWRGADRREERYAAIELLARRAYAPYRTIETLPVLEEMIVTGAWWDYVDAIATHRLRELLARHPDEMTATMRAWSRDADPWKRRAAILCQVGRKGDTDLALLFDCIEPNLEQAAPTGAARRRSPARPSRADPRPVSPSDRFFIRKAIGWALRDYAWHDLDTVERWVERNTDRLSPLSRREALKNRDALRSGRAGRAGRARRRRAPAETR